ncbi:MAG: carbamoyltransferase HypF [Pirellulales bacterium]
MGENMQRRRFEITGLVQGVGFRPFLWRLARRYQLAGWVENSPSGVSLEVAGNPAAIDAFLGSLQAEPPPLARIDAIMTCAVTAEPLVASYGGWEFVIRPSARGGGLCAGVLPDVAPCEACLAELWDPRDRRYRYPFLNCTNCGPRLTIQTALPYDRPQTTMAGFAMCEACRGEYADPANRRFHAQPIACPHCGPVAWYTEREPTRTLAVDRAYARHLGDAAITLARSRLRTGRLLAVKGVGGFHLIGDATKAETIDCLRRRKHRPRKPFAVMVPDLATAAMLTEVDDQAARFLEDPSRPIVLLPKLRQPRLALAESVAPESDFLGVMLPSSPLHVLLTADCDGSVRPLVVTSGNLADEPIVHTNAAAVARLAGIADGFVMHDRPIQVPCDDSVVRCLAGMLLPMRLGRGHAPTTLPLPEDGPSVLAVGGELKNTLCLTVGRQAIVGPHLGDLASPASLSALTRSAHHLLALYDVKPTRIVADLHPGYLSTAWARDFAADAGVPLVQVQHHEAHAAALLAEHGLSLKSPQPMLVACFDGTGYGRDGTVQGGEFLLVHEGSIRRVAHLANFRLPGGDVALREPWRAAVGCLAELSPTMRQAWPWPWLSANQPTTDERLALVAQQAALGLASPITSSMGRLFDAVASLAGLCHSISFEAEAALLLEAAATRYSPQESRESGYHFELPTNATAWPLVIRWQPLLSGVSRDLASGVPTATVASLFHEAVASMIVQVAQRLRDALASGPSCVPLTTIGLTGGVFQNRLLCELALAHLDQAGFEPLLPVRLPANDGGLSLGQAILGRR